MVILVSVQTLPGFLLAMACYGIAAAFLGVAPAAVVGDVVHGRGGTVIAAYQMAADFGAIVGPLLAGWLADEVGFGPAFAVGGVILAASALLATRMPETRDASPPDPDR
jgi:MFS transporter, DHA1 family, multidrug resistance protein